MLLIELFLIDFGVREGGVNRLRVRVVVILGGSGLLRALIQPVVQV